MRRPVRISDDDDNFVCEARLPGQGIEATLEIGRAFVGWDDDGYLHSNLERADREHVMKNRKTAIVIANDFPPQHGGIQTYMREIASHLDADDSIVVLAPSQPSSTNFDERQPYRIVRFRGASKIGSFFTLLALFLVEALRRRPSYTVASIWFPSGLVSLFVPRAIRGSLGILAHGTEIAPSKGGLRRRLMQLTYSKADFVFANSSFTASLLAEVGVTKNVRVVHCGCEPRTSARRRSERPTILSVGRLVERKGFDRMIEAMPAILQAHPTACYEIVGAGPYEATLRRLAIERGVASHIVFLGALDDDALALAYARAWCFALPVRRIGDDVEGFGIVYLEAAMAGLPVIAGIDSGGRDAVADGVTGTVIDGSNAADVANAVSSMLNDERSSEAMGEAGQMRALRTFSWKSAVGKIRETLVDTRKK